MPLLTGFNIANVERIKIVTNETTARTFVFDTASSCDASLAVSSGTEVEQRIKNTIMGLLKTDDVVKGYDITLEDQRLIHEVFALIDGGTDDVTGSSTPTWNKYDGPVAGSPVTRKSFTLFLYTSDRDAGASVNSYHSWKFTNCKGKPVPLGSKDGEFHTIQYSIESRPQTGSPVFTLTPEESLPSPT